MEEHEAPSKDIIVPNSPHAEIRREELDEHVDPVDPMEIVDVEILTGKYSFTININKIT